MIQDDSFEDFLNKKVQDDNDSKKGIEQRKLEWKKSIDNLYSNIQEWLAPYVENQSLKIDIKDNFSSNNEHFGESSLLEISIGSGINKITLIPEGNLMMGSFGKIKMRSSKGEKDILQPEWNKWQFVNKDLEKNKQRKGQLQNMLESVYPVGQVKPTREEVNKTTFQAVIKELLD